MPFSRGCHLPDPGIEPQSLISPALAGGFFTTSATWEAPTIHQMQTSTVRFHLYAHTYEVSEIVKFIESEGTLVDAGHWTRGWGRWGDGELVFNGDRVSV